MCALHKNKTKFFHWIELFVGMLVGLSLATGADAGISFTENDIREAEDQKVRALLPGRGVSSWDVLHTRRSKPDESASGRQLFPQGGIVEDWGPLEDKGVKIAISLDGGGVKGLM